ncbi:conserved hypothetical protein, membrane [Candidatus Magnetomorum sp. HK-1]|nr:conserved hypothetical protein, membrane [Candidatus Magnetomorum sp. HK-1]
MDVHKEDQYSTDKQLLTKTILVIAFCIFLFTQFYSIYFRLYNHNGPIGLGDSSYYISRIAYFKEHNIFPRSDLFTLSDSLRSDSYECVYPYYIFYGIVSSFALGKLCTLTNVSAEQMFHFNFYIGILLIALILLLLFKKINKDSLFAAAGFIIFAFYNGSGNYHGFYWVVPSFYSLLFLYINIIIFFYTKKWKWIAPFSIFLLLFSHPLSLFCIALISFALFIHGLLTKSISSSLVKIVYLCLWSFFYMIIYKYLYINDIIFPLFAESLSFNSLLSFEGKGYADLWNQTPFVHYFFEAFLPLTISSIYYCIKKKEYILISLFFSSLTGILLFCFIHPYASRVFLYFENMLLLIYIVACYYSVQFFINSGFKTLSLKQEVYQISAFLFNGAILLLCFCLFLFFMKDKLANDAGHKFQHSLFFKSEKFIQYINNTNNSDKLYLLDSMGSAFMLLHLDGFWNKSFIKPCMLPLILDFEEYKDKVFIGANLKMYEKNRSGIGLFLPKSGKIVLKSDLFQPATCRLVLSDTGLKPEVIKNIQLEFDSKKPVEIVSNGWKSKPMSVLLSDTNKYPKFIPPWYSLLISYLKKRTQEGFLIVRKNQQYYIDFIIKSPIKKVYLKNMGEQTILYGSIELQSLESNQSVYYLDTDWGSENEINSHAGFSLGENEYPLLWKDPVSEKKIRISKTDLIPELFTLTESFQDIKTFQLFNKFIGIINNEN